jgi:kinesin family protein C1
LSSDCERARAELAKVVEERDEKAAEVKTLSAENARYRECTGKSAAEMESLSNKATALEVSPMSPLKPV